MRGDVSFFYGPLRPIVFNRRMTSGEIITHYSQRIIDASKMLADRQCTDRVFRLDEVDEKIVFIRIWIQKFITVFGNKV